MQLIKRLFILALFVASPCYAQALDNFGGRTDITCANPTHFLAFTVGTLGPASTAGSITVTNASTIFGTSPTMSIIITGTGTALDYVFDATDVNAGAAVVTSVSGNVINFTNHVSGTVSNATGNMQPGRSHLETITIPYGTGKFFCTPQNHFIFYQGISAACSGVQFGSNACGASNLTVSSASQTGGVVTMTQGATTTVTWGEQISITSCVDTTYNGTFAVQSVTSPNIFTYNKSTTNGSTTGCKVQPLGWAAKYGGSGQTAKCNTAQNEEKRFKDLGFNIITEDADSEYITSGPCTFSGFMPQVPPANIPLSQNQYSTVNLNGSAPQPVMFLTIAATGGSPWGFDRTFTIGGGSPTNLDWFSPNFDLFFRTQWGVNATGLINALKSPLSAFVMADDSDFQNISLGGQWMSSFPRAKNSNNGAFMIAVTAPYQSYSSVAAQIYQGNPHIYPDNQFKSKRLSAVAPSGCWLSSNPTQFVPCSLPDFARFTYGTVAAMNAAWGSNYTTFGSSETVNTQTLEATGDGTTTTFSIALGANVTPGSIQVFLHPNGGAATDTSGDCPHMYKGCGGSNGGGTINSTHSCNSGSPSYNNTKVANNFVCVDSNNDLELVSTGGTTGTTPTWPATNACSGIQTTTWGGVTATCIGPALVTATSTITYSTGNGTLTFANAPASGETILMSWTNGGWDAGGTGLADEDGSGSWVGTNPICIVAPLARQASTSYTAWDIKNGAVIADTTSNTWQLATTTGATGSGPTPAFSANRGDLLTDGGVIWASLGAPVCGTSAGTDYNVAINANQTWAAFMMLFLGQYAAQYTSVEYNDAKTLWPDLIVLGPDFGLQSYSNPMDPDALIAMNAYSDAAFTGTMPYFIGNTDGSLGNLGIAALKVVEHYYTKPIIEERIWQVGTDTVTGAMSWQNNLDASTTGGCNTVSAVPHYCFRSTNGTPNALVSRANAMYSQTQKELTMTNEAGQLQYAGWTWWGGNGDFQVSSWAFVDNLDNAIDGKENVISAVSCSGSLSSFGCGNEVASVPWLGIDEINCVQCLKATTALWLTPVVSPITAPMFLIAKE